MDLLLVVSLPPHPCPLIPAPLYLLPTASATMALKIPTEINIISTPPETVQSIEAEPSS